VDVRLPPAITRATKQRGNALRCVAKTRFAALYLARLLAAWEKFLHALPYTIALRSI